jgi:hypothetical protein
MHIKNIFIIEYQFQLYLQWSYRLYPPYYLINSGIRQYYELSHVYLKFTISEMAYTVYVFESLTLYIQIRTILFLHL